VKCAQVTLDLHNQQIDHAYIAGAMHRLPIVQTNTVRGTAHPVLLKFMVFRAENTICVSSNIRKYMSALL